MALSDKTIRYNLEIKSDAAQAKKSLDDLRLSLQQLSSTKITDPFGNIDKSAQHAVLEVQKLYGEIQNSTSFKSNNLMLDKLASSWSKNQKSVSMYVDELRKLGPTGEQAANQLMKALENAYTPANKMSGVLGKVFRDLGRDIVKSFNYSLINKFTQSLAGAVSYSKQLNQSLTDIRIVSEHSTNEMTKFAKEANEAARNLGSTTLEFTRGALIYYQQGLSDTEVMERTAATIKMANTSGESAEDISSYMTAIWNNFVDGSHTIEYYADVISKLGAATAATNAEIAEGMQSFAAIADTVGLSYEYAASALTTIVSTTRQSSSTVGNALKTIFSRLDSVSLGETLEDGVDYTKYTKALAQVGVEAVDVNGDLRNMNDILDDLGNRWESLNQAQKVGLAQTVGGVRQYTNLITLLDHYDEFKDNVNLALNSEGTLEAQNAVYLQSWAAASDQVKTAFQKIYSLLIDDQLMIKITKGFAGIVDITGSFLENIGGLATLLPTVVGLIMAFAGDKISTNLRSMASSMADWLGYETRVKNAEELRKQAIRKDYEVPKYATSKDPQVKAAQENISSSMSEALERYFNVEKNITDEEREQYRLKMENVRRDQESLQTAEKRYAIASQQTELAIDKYFNGQVFDDDKIKENIEKAAIIDSNDNLAITGLRSAFGTGEDGKPAINYNNFGDLQEAINTLQSNDAYKDGFSEDIQTFINSVNDEKVDLDELNKLYNKIIGASNERKTQTEQLIEDINDDLDVQIDEIVKRLKELDNKLEELRNKDKGKESAEYKSARKERRKLKRKYNSIKQEMDNKAENNTDADDKAERESKEKRAEAIKRLSQAYQDQHSATVNLDKTVKDTKVDIEALNEETKRFQKTAADSSAEALSNGLTGLATAGMAVVSTYGLISSATSTLFDNQASLGQKVMALVSIFSAMGPVLATYAKGISLLSKAKLAFTTAMKAAKDAAKNEAIAQAASNAATVEGTVADGVAIGVKGTLTVVVNALAKAFEKLTATIGLWGFVFLGAIAAISVFIGIKKQLDENRKQSLESREKELEQDKALINSTLELSSAIDTLTDEYLSLRKAGSSTYEVFNKLKEQAPDLIKKYKELGLEVDAITEAYNKGVDTGNWDDFIEENKALEKETKSKQWSDAKELMDISNRRMADAEGIQGGVDYGGTTYKLHVGGYNTQPFKKDDGTYTNEESYANEILKDKLGDNASIDSNKLGTNITANLNDPRSMIKVYEGMVDAKREMEESMTDDQLTHSDTYREICEVITNMTGEYEKAKESAQDFYDLAKSDFDAQGAENMATALGLVDEAGKASFNSLKDYALRQTDMLNWIKQEYAGITDAEAEALLKSSEAYGVLERTQVHFEQLAESGKMDLGWSEEDAQKFITDSQAWYDNLPDEVKKYAMYVSLEKPENFNEQVQELYDDALNTEYQQRGVDAGLDADELSDYADHLRQISEEVDILDDSLMENKSAATAVAKDVMRMNDGIEKLADNWEEWSSVLNKSSKTSEEYSNAIGGVRDSLSTMLDVEKEFITESFVEDHLTDIEAASKGDEEAIRRLQLALSDDIIANILLNNEIDDTRQQEILNSIDEFRNYLDSNPITVGMEFDRTNFNASMDASEADFLDMCQKIIDQSGMTVEQAQAYFNSLGFETKFKKEPEVITTEKYETLTSSYVAGHKSYPYFDPITGKEVGKYDVPEIATRTDVGKKYTTNDVVEAFAMSTNGKSPIIESMTATTGGHRGTSINNRSSSNPGGRSSGSKGSTSGGSPKKKDTKEKKQSNTEIKRYEVINNKLEETEADLKRIKTAEDRAFGVDKVSAMANEVTLLNEKLSQYNEKLKEANDPTNGYLTKDRSKLNSYGFGIQYNADGIITNYEDVMEKAIKKYNDAVNTYNNSAQEDSDNDAFQKAEEEYNQFIKDYEQYNETLNLIDELEQNITDTLNEIADKKLEIITTKIEYNVQVNDNDIELLEFLLEQIEKKSYSAADAINNLGNQAKDMMDKIAGYQRGISEILSSENTNLSQSDIINFLNGKISADEIIKKGNFTQAQQEQLQEYAKNIKDVTSELIELRENAYAKLSETLDEFTEDIEEQKDAISSSINVLNNYKNVIDTLGKKNLGLTSDTLKSIADVQLVAAKGNVDISRSSMESIKNTLDELMATSTAGMSDAEKKLLQDQIDYYTKSYHEALETYTSDLSAAAQEVANIFEVAINNICDSFSEAIGGLSANLADLQTRFDQSNTLKDQTLADYERLYQLNKLNKKINDSIDDSTTVKSKQLLASLQDEINKKEAQGVELSEYDLEVYQRRYELYLAQIALEEAQNAKSQVRMTKDSNGNWSYTYVADDDKMQKAQEEYENKLYEYAKLNEDYVKETESTILSLEAEFKDALAALDPTDGEYEKKKQELMDYYNARLKFYSGQLTNALKSNEEVASYEEAADWNVATSFGDTILGQLIGTGDLDTYMNDVFKAMTKAVEEASEAYEEYQENLSDTVGDLVDLNDTVSGAIEDVVDATDTAKNKAVELSETFETAFDEADTALKEFSDNYSTYIDGMITKTEQLLNLINQLYETKSGEDSGVETPDIQTPTGFDTGGYTGAWGSMGKLAILHEKELVLNANDTRNFLQTMNYMRELTNALDARAAFASTGLGEMNSLAVGEHMQQLEQEVHISANFPNVVNHLEIEEAFNNLVNMASQYVNRK